MISTPYNAPQRNGVFLVLTVAAATLLYPGGLVALNAAGAAVPATDTAGLQVVGRCEGLFDNSTGAAGDIVATIQRGVFRYANSGSDPVAQADIGNIAFIEDDSIICKVGATNKVRAGRIVDVDDDGVWIDTRQTGQPYTLTAVTVATANGSDAGTTQALANALKTAVNAVIVDLAAINARTI